jgi:hypothetical protein
MTLKSKLLICLSTLIGVGATVQKLGWPLARLNVHVIGEGGVPVNDANVTISFRERFSDRNAWATGKTDSQGNFAAEGHSDKRLGGSVGKVGYYDSGTGWIIFKDQDSGRWQPWGTTVDVILRPIGNPIPLAVKKVQEEVPALNQPCGYDLEIGDWTAPHGSGKRADLTFNIRSQFEDRSNFETEAEVTFAQRLDGLARMKSPAYARYSALRWERSASESGYVSLHKIHHRSRDVTTHVKRDRSFDQTKENEEGYFFRVRTVEENGRIVSANYGKITGDIAIDPRDSSTCSVMFTYYFNPTLLDRNVEWDPNRNLLSTTGTASPPGAP